MNYDLKLGGDLELGTPCEPTLITLNFLSSSSPKPMREWDLEDLSHHQPQPQQPPLL